MGSFLPAPAARDLALLRRYHQYGDRSARELLASRGMPLVRSIVRRYRHSGEPAEDLLQVGAMGLVKAIDGFDIHRGSNFVSYAAPSISGELKRHFRDHTWHAHVPRAMQELNARVRQAQQDLESADHHEPAIEEIAQRLDESLTQVRAAMAVTGAHRAQSIDQPAPDGSSLASKLGTVDRELELVEVRELVRQCIGVLDERQRKVVWMRFFEDRLQREIAHEIGVSQMQVSRVLTTSFERMREFAQGREAAGGRRHAAALN
ncbi:MAG: sigma-70 family RNA polymerase sigma factor [Patulibacter sp.]|nr:sigma-70 family RNA polymerase sigma factor [Patulibacter sp.]